MGASECCAVTVASCEQQRGHCGVDGGAGNVAVAVAVGGDVEDGGQALWAGPGCLLCVVLRASVMSKPSSPADSAPLRSVPPGRSVGTSQIMAGPGAGGLRRQGTPLPSRMPCSMRQRRESRAREAPLQHVLQLRTIARWAAEAAVVGSWQVLMVRLRVAEAAPLPAPCARAAAPRARRRIVP